MSQPLTELTVVIITKNEALMLANCIQNLLPLTKNILVIDNGSVDETLAIAQEFGLTTYQHLGTDFAKLRNFALKKVKTPWLLYLDADERMTPSLATEIDQTIHNASSELGAATLARENIFYGQAMQATGYDPEHDRVTRLFRTKNLQEWFGRVHESAIYEGQTILLKNNLLHLTHRQTRDGLIKSAQWTFIEAQLIAANPQTPPVKGGLILRKGFGEFYRRYFKSHGYRDHLVGFIESLIQAINKALVYIQVWELQQQPDLVTQYQTLEQQLLAQWPQT